MPAEFDGYLAFPANHAYAGTDFIVAHDGLIASVYLFFDELR